MKFDSKLSPQKTLFYIGFIITIIGFIIHFSQPSDMGNNFNNDGSRIDDLESMASFEINPEIKKESYNFQLSILATGYADNEIKSDFTIIILNATEFEKYNAGAEIEDLKVIKKITAEFEPELGQPTHRKVVSFSEPQDIHLIIINGGNESINVNVTYYYSNVSLSYYYGIIMVFFGIGMLFLAGIMYFEDWKKYFLIGIFPNVILFFIRVSSLTLFFGHPILYLLQVEMYSDFQFWYMGWAPLFKEGVGLYSNAMRGYEYGPLFMLTIGPFAFLPHIWCMGIPIFLSGIATGYLVYKIVFTLTNNPKRARYALLLYLLNPFILFYSSFAWLNPSLFVFFVVLCFYLLLNRRISLSFISLGIATMYKQFAIIFFPLILIFIFKQNREGLWLQKLKSLLHYSSDYLITILIISFPFLLFDFDSYVNRILFNNSFFSMEQNNTLIYFIAMSVNFNDFFLLIGGPNGLTYIISVLLTFYIFLGICFIIVYTRFLFYKPLKFDKTDDSRESNQYYIQMIYLSIFLIITVQLFYPRGTYKYYLVLLAPFISIFYDYNDLTFLEKYNPKNYEMNQLRFTNLVFSYAVFFCYRYLYFWILVIWVIYYAYMRYNGELKSK